MRPRITTLTLALAAASTFADLPAQHLRLGLARARYVCIARPVGLQPLGNELFIHHYELIEALRGQPADRFSIVERKRVADTPKPQQGPTRLLCLVDDRATVVPERHRPVYRMTGYRGDHPAVGDDAAWRDLRSCADLLLASLDGAAPATTCEGLLALALRGEGSAARLEATRSLHEREVLRDHINEVEANEVLTLAIGEGDDIDVKVALAELAHDLHGAAAVEPLCMALQQCGDARYTTALGQLIALEHGEAATEVLVPRIDQTRGVLHDRLLLTLGATRTRSALQDLLRRRSQQGARPELDAALRAHGAAEALRVLREGTDGGR